VSGEAAKAERATKLTRMTGWLRSGKRKVRNTTMFADATSLEGKFLVAMPGMGDSRFEKSVIYLCAHSGEGSMGFIINRPLETPGTLDFLEQLNIIAENERDGVPENVVAAGLHTGGPVEQGRGFVLHSPDYQAEGTLKVDGKVCLTATLEVLRELAIGKGPEKFLMALGYSGWSAGQLEEELAANGWLIAECDSDIIFSADAGAKYARAMQSMGINPGLLSQETGHA